MIRNKKGFTILELVIVVFMSMILLASIYNIFIDEHKAICVQEMVVEMNQKVRAGMDLMVSEIRMAGYDPQDIGLSGFDSPSSTYLKIIADLDKNGDPNDANEKIEYSYDSDNLVIRRRLNNGEQMILADNIQDLSFEYFDVDGNDISDPSSSISDIRRIRISIVGRIQRPDQAFPENNGYRIFRMSSFVTPPNLNM